jgi:Tfp pilus assembly protein PilZ
MAGGKWAYFLSIGAIKFARAVYMLYLYACDVYLQAEDTYLYAEDVYL